MKRLSKKWANYRRRYHYVRHHLETPTGPLYINLEPTNACNLRCRHCSIDGTRKRGFMDLGLFRKIIDEASASGVYEVALFLGGEPLLHKDLPYMVEYVEAKGLQSRVYTNACFLTREKSEALLDAGLSFLAISFDGDAKEEYESIRIGADFDEVLSNVTTMLELKKERQAAKPYVSLQMIKLLENPNQEIAPEFISRFEGLPVSEFACRNPHDWRGEKNDIELEHRGDKYFPCQTFWSAISIAWDGRVIGCSADLNGSTVLGDLKEQTIMEVWNGEQIVHHRRLQKEGRFRELPLCANCQAVWHKGHPRISMWLQLPPFEQIRTGLCLLRPGSKREIIESASPGAIRNRK